MKKKYWLGGFALVAAYLTLSIAFGDQMRPWMDWVTQTSTDFYNSTADERSDIATWFTTFGIAQAIAIFAGYVLLRESIPAIVRRARAPKTRHRVPGRSKRITAAILAPFALVALVAGIGVGSIAIGESGARASVIDGYNASTNWAGDTWNDMFGEDEKAKTAAPVTNPTDEPKAVPSEKPDQPSEVVPSEPVATPTGEPTTVVPADEPKTVANDSYADKAEEMWTKTLNWVDAHPIEALAIALAALIFLLLRLRAILRVRRMQQQINDLKKEVKTLTSEVLNLQNGAVRVVPRPRPTRSLPPQV